MRMHNTEVDVATLMTRYDQEDSNIFNRETYIHGDVSDYFFAVIHDGGSGTLCVVRKWRFEGFEEVPDVWKVRTLQHVDEVRRQGLVWGL